MKAIIQIGYTKYVVDAEKAIKLLQILENAETYETKWHDRTDDVDSFISHHIFTEDHKATIQPIEFMQDALYRLAKDAGKPW